MLYKTAFMSHAHADNAKCDPYADALQKRGISLYYDRANPQLGRDLGITLEREIQQANALIVMVTPSALKSFWVNEEISMFFTLMAQDSTRLLIPVKLEPCELPPRLAARWWIDATAQPAAQVINQLANALTTDGQAGISSPASPPVVYPDDNNAPIHQAGTSSSVPWSPAQSMPIGALPPPDSTPSKEISRRALIVTGALGVAAIGTGVIWWSKSTFPLDMKPTATATLTPSLSSFSHGVLTYHGHSRAVDSVEWSPDGTNIASGSEDRTVQIWDAISGKRLSKYQVTGIIVHSVAWASDSQRIALDDGSVDIWNVVSGVKLFTYSPTGTVVWSVAWSPDGTRICVGNTNGTVQVWSTASDRPLYTCYGDSNVQEVAWSPNGKYIASAYRSGSVYIWNATSGGIIYIYRGHSDNMLAISWSPNSLRVASASDDKSVLVWDATNGGHQFVYSGHSDSVFSAKWSPDGSRIASASGDKTVQVWDASNGSHAYIYRGHSDAVYSVSWSPDGKQIASASQDKTVQVWHPQ